MNICKKCGGQLIPSFDNDNRVEICFNKNCYTKPIKPRVDSKKIEMSGLKNDFFKHNEKVSKSDNIAIMISNIKKLRMDRGLGQSDISELLGVSTQRYGTIDRDENIPTALILGKLARIFGIGLGELYTMIEVTPEEYEMLSNMSEVNELVVIDPQIKELRNDILDYEQKTGVVDRKIYKSSNDSDELKEIKNHLKKLDEKYSKYNSKVAILKQEYVIDYYHYQKAIQFLDQDKEQ